MTSDSNRRKYVRIPDNSVITCEKYAIPRKGADERYEVKARNLSAGGLLFVTDKKFNMADILRLEVEIHNWEKFKAEFYKPDALTTSKPLVVIAEVVRVEAIGGGKYEIGVDFSGMDEGHRLALDKYVKKAAQ